MNTIKGTSKDEINFFIGSNNETGELDLNTIRKAFYKQFVGVGFSILTGEGYFKDKETKQEFKEKSCIVKVLIDNLSFNQMDDILNFTQNLKRDLKQYAIYITKQHLNFIEV